MEKRKYTQEEKKVLKSMFIRSHLTFLSFNMTKMEANGFTTTMQPAIESIYGNDEEAKRKHTQDIRISLIPMRYLSPSSPALHTRWKRNIRKRVP